jgi:hypothetical protein
MKIASVWILAFVLAGALKLFTYEYYLRDDPTCGIAARSHPSLVSHQVLQASDLVLFSDENDFPGSRIYQVVVGWGYLVVLAGGLFVFYLRNAHPRKV